MTRPRLAGWHLTTEIGRGGFASVWQARRPGGDERFAAKLSRTGTLAAVRRFSREAAALARIGPPGAPRLIDLGQDRQLPYLVMEWIDGRSPTACPPTSLEWVCKVASTLIARVRLVHVCGLVHADLKPDNIRVTESGDARLLDFGLAVAAGESGAIGTPRYAAPEQLRREPVVSATDVYALGSVIYEMLAGEPPFADDPVYGNLFLRPPPIQDAPAALRQAVAASLAKRPDERPTLDELAHAVASAREIVSVTGGSPGQRAAWSRELLALAAIDTDAAAIDVVAEAEAGRGFVVRQRGRRWLFAFDSSASPTPVEAARAFAHRVRARFGAQAALHLCACRVRRRTRGAPAVEPPPDRDWIPERFAGVTMTESFAGTIPADEGGTAALVGRGQLLDAARDSRRESFRTRTPGLFLVTGAPGTGKTRLARELVDELRREVDLVVLGEPPPTAGVPTAVVIDDAEQVSEAVLDAVEYATLDAAERPLWVALFARPELERRRPRFGERAASRHRLELGPLDPDAARALAEDLLQPATLVPDRVIDTLTAWAGGNPGDLVDLVRAIRRAGMIRKRPDVDRWYVAAEQLHAVSAAAPAVWVATRELEHLPPDLADVAMVCAALSPGFTPEQVAAVAGDLRADPEIALHQLAARGWLRADPAGGWSYASALLQGGVLAVIDRGRRRDIHERAFAYWRDRADSAGWPGHEALAMHAAASGAVEDAAAAHLRLATDARIGHRYVDADRHFTAAQAHGADVATASLGRGAVRYRLDRLPEAIADLEAAEHAARLRGDDRLRAEAQLELATALDWAGRYADSDRCASAARAVVRRLADPVLEARLAAARGRSALRKGNTRDAIRWLSAGADAGAACGDHDARVVSLLLLGPALVQVGRLDAAAARFDEVIALCERAGDPLHLCAAYGNRVALWSARGDPVNTRGDLERARELSRRLGHAVPERNTTYNLAEYLYWSGDDAAALALAERSRTLQARCVGPPLADALLCARIRSSLGDVDGARADLVAARASTDLSSWPRPLRALARALELTWSHAAAAEWDSLEHEASELPVEDRLELAYWRARTTGDRDAIDRARTLLETQPVWRVRFAALET